MKKRISIILAALLTSVFVTGCGSEKDKSLDELKVEKYVTLGEYKGIQVTVPNAEINEAEKSLLVQQIYYSYYNDENGGITDRAVKNGDMVNIDYEGKLDGVAFDGGTAQNQQLGIGSDSFIEGFEDGLIGVKPGETVDLNLTFPTKYHSAELAGKAVVFTVTVNYIYPPYSDEEVASWGQDSYKTVAELEEFVQNYMEMTNQSNYDYYLETAVIGKFLEGCTYKEIPDWLVEKYRNNLKESLESSAAMYGMDVEGYSQYVNGMSAEEFLDSCSLESAKQLLALQAVANAEGLNMTEEELDAAISEQATLNGYASVEEFMGERDRDDYREYFMFEDMIDYLIDNAVVSTES